MLGRVSVSMDAAADPNRPLSQLSIAALVCAIGGVALPCCPVFPLLAVVLGFVARSRIRRGVPVRGAGLALAAMVLGGVGLLAQGLAFDWMAGRFQGEVESRSLDRMERLMAAATAADRDATLAAWPRRHGGRVDESIAFAAEAIARYGPFESISVSGWTYGGDFGEPDVLAATVWRFRDRDLTGTFRMRLVPGTSLADPYPTPVPLELLIADETLGDLRVGGGSDGWGATSSSVGNGSDPSADPSAEESDLPRPSTEASPPLPSPEGSSTDSRSGPTRDPSP
jgi:hypothetical protein